MPLLSGNIVAIDAIVSVEKVESVFGKYLALFPELLAGAREVGRALADRAQGQGVILTLPADAVAAGLASVRLEAALSTILRNITSDGY